MLAGILIGLVMAGLAIPLTYGIITHNWIPATGTYHLQRCFECCEHCNAPIMETEHQGGQCICACNHDWEKCCECCNRTTVVFGTITSKDPNNGILMLKTNNGTLKILVLGRWSDGENIITYYELLSKLQVGDKAEITIISTLHNTVHALKIDVDCHEYIRLGCPGCH